MKNNLLIEISHELQTPTAIVQGNIELIIPVVPRAQRSILRRAQKSITRASRSISHLMKLARLGSIVKSIKVKPLSLAVFLSEIVIDMKWLAQSKGIKVSSFCSPRATALADPEFMREVVCNLITNSVRHTKRGGKIVIRARTKGDRILVSVSDNGRGIARSELERIFEYLYSGDESRSQGGYGLGLNICREIVLAHKGEISVRSVAGKGATFSVLLPRANIDQ